MYNIIMFIIMMFLILSNDVVSSLAVCIERKIYVIQNEGSNLILPSIF